MDKVQVNDDHVQSGYQPYQYLDADKQRDPFMQGTGEDITAFNQAWFPNLNSRKRLALLTTVTDENAIAVPAMIGLSSIPVSG